ncbi:putative serine/threonine-protein kinase [Podospora australis]|uniref:Autophagy-related protein 1 n=1 Tax=Podospora australis TaxID=1536484 RepID=A0AAN7APA8_9PEZI|nr:putative serine/threonine-protein kinase [Podospora australis]
MDSSGEGSQPTQATQTIVDPRRYGEQNSGFSDEDIADIICILVPYSPSAREELRTIVAQTPEFTVERADADDLTLEEDTPNSLFAPRDTAGEHQIALRFSAQVKNPQNGFVFGRNRNCCDVTFKNDPFRRLSNTHFRIYLNKHGVLMLEDESTNGTFVEGSLLKKKVDPPHEVRRTLSNGNIIKILLFEPSRDLVFMVRVPARKGHCRTLYQENLENYLYNQAQLEVDVNATIVPGPGGRVDVFKNVQTAPRTPAVPNQAVRNVVAVRRQADNGHRRRQNDDLFDGVSEGWAGSKRYNRVGEIGRGAFATVYKVTRTFSGEPYAAKELDKRRFMKNGVLDQKVENEMKIMQKVTHPNIVQYVEHLDWDDRLLIIIMEYVGKGDLGRLISDHGPLAENATKIMAGQLLDALGYLHKMNITHRDVKPDNILVSSHEPFVVKLTDFGLSKMIDHEQTFLRTFCGTLLYCAPEVYSEYAEYDSRGRRHPRNRRLRPTTGQRYDNAVDIWSLGGVIFYTLTRQPPFPAQSGASHSALLHQIMTKPLNITPLEQADISSDGIEFLRAMLDRNPETRATVDALQTHPWLAPEPSPPPPPSQEISDEALSLNASYLSIEDQELRIPDDNDDDDELIPDSQEPATGDRDETVNDVLLGGNESEKENTTFGPTVQPQRLFGEVNASAMGSTGGVAAERLNVPVSKASFGSSASTEILGAGIEIKDSFDSDSSTPRQNMDQLQSPSSALQASISLGQSSSVEDLSNKTFDVASQSLGGTESILEHLNMKSRVDSVIHQPAELTTSKRKQSPETSDESEKSPTEQGRGLKRLRSDTSGKAVTKKKVDRSDYELIAQVPAVTRGNVRLTNDMPVHKSTFWCAQDKTSWHLNYPEMTQMQYDAFTAAVEARGEEFAPEKSPLFDLAMKYFPPLTVEPVENGTPESPFAADDDDDEPPRPPALDTQQIVPDGLPNALDLRPYDTMSRLSVPGKPVVATLTSSPDSSVADIRILVTEALVSFGRARENTRRYTPKTEDRVPKFAFKVMLWQPGYDPAVNSRPWNRVPETNEDAMTFYISTKSTNGISINGVHLPSHDVKNSGGACKYWMALHDGDIITVWEKYGREVITEVIFRCSWGYSAKRRPSQGPLSVPSLVPEPVSTKLDSLVNRTERKMRSMIIHDLRMAEANRDLNTRIRRVQRERDFLLAFEKKRQQACRYHGGSRHSPMSGITFGDSSTAHASGWASHLQAQRTVPMYRRPSPTASELLRMARY